MNHATWNPLAELSHPTSVTGPQNVVVYKEIEEEPPRGNGTAASPSSRIPKSRYVVCELPIKVPSQKPAIDKPNPKLGVGTPPHPFSTRETYELGNFWWRYLEF